jgi:UDP-2,3-diacylglucosamine hydrolase
VFRPGPGPIAFISDCHLGAPVGPPERTEWLVELLEGWVGRIGGLLVVGDLFDFWFEYRHAIPKGHFAVCRALAGIQRAGAPVLYFGGNHDFWAGSYLSEEIGLEVADGPRSMLLQGKRFFIAHGDGLGGGDQGYKFLKRVLRNRVCIALYRSIHPDLGIPFAYRLSAVSRRHTQPREVIVPKLCREIAEPALREGHDTVVIGHIHEPTHRRLGAGSFVILGDWLENFTYGILEDGRFRLLRRRPGSDPAADPEIPIED